MEGPDEAEQQYEQNIEEAQLIEEEDQSALSEWECSFTPQTLVTTDTGEKPIVTLKPGKRVLSYNPKTHKMEWKPIVHVWIHTDNDLVDLTITKMTHEKGVKPTNEVLHTNKKHPFLTVEKGFLPVGQIKLGMHVVEADGYLGVISGWKIVPGSKTMYNLEVAQDHTFTVGVGQWIVHNCGLTNTATQASQEEINAANYVASIKNDPGDTVILRDPTGPRSTLGGTSDLVVNGVNYDIYSPETNNIKQVLSAAAGKYTQGNGVVIDLSKTSLTSADLGNALVRMRGFIASWGGDPSTLRDVIVYDPKTP
jgi:hypothetical protein